MFSLVKQVVNGPAEMSLYGSESEAVEAVNVVRFDERVESVTVFRDGVAIMYAFDLDAMTEVVYLDRCLL